jgi:hypothetical protein
MENPHTAATRLERHYVAKRFLANTIAREREVSSPCTEKNFINPILKLQQKRIETFNCNRETHIKVLFTFGFIHTRAAKNCALHNEIVRAYDLQPTGNSDSSRRSGFVCRS